MDIRHPLQHFDVMMLEWAYSRKLFVHVLLTKSDKLNRGPASKVLQVQQQLKKMKLQFSIQLFSSMNKQGLEELASVMGGRLNFTLEQASAFDLDSIPDASADEIEFVEGDEELFDENEFEDATFDNESIDNHPANPLKTGNNLSVRLSDQIHHLLISECPLLLTTIEGIFFILILKLREHTHSEKNNRTG